MRKRAKARAAKTPTQIPMTVPMGIDDLAADDVEATSAAVSLGLAESSVEDVVGSSEEETVIVTDGANEPRLEPWALGSMTREVGRAPSVGTVNEPVNPTGTELGSCLLYNDMLNEVVEDKG